MPQIGQLETMVQCFCFFMCALALRSLNTPPRRTAPVSVHSNDIMSNYDQRDIERERDARVSSQMSYTVYPAVTGKKVMSLAWAADAEIGYSCLPTESHGVVDQFQVLKLCPGW